MKATCKNVSPGPIYIGIDSSRNPEALNNTGLPLEFTPYWIRSGSDELVTINTNALNHFTCSPRL